MIRIVEVGPRDGLQNEKTILPTEVKVALVDALSDARPAEIEVSAFVSPKWVPQLADAAEVFRRIARAPGVVYSALVPNLQGLERALEVGVRRVAVFTAASETFNRKNINASIDESFERFAPVLERARREGVEVRGYVSTAFWCPYEGRVMAARAVEVIRRLIDAGVQEVSVGDTIGKAVPGEVRELLERLLPHVPASRLAMHFHDTYGGAVVNVLESHRMGIGTFDSSVAGIGGCPYAPGAAGNVATEAVVRALRGAGAGVEVDLGALGAARDLLAAALGRPLAEPGK